MEAGVPCEGLILTAVHVPVPRVNEHAGTGEGPLRLGLEEGLELILELPVGGALQLGLRQAQVLVGT